MPYNFCGLSVTGFQSQASLGSGSGGLRVSLVEDPLAGDAPNFPAVGQPVYFTAGDFSFGGILSRFGKDSGPAGVTWSADVDDASVVLDAASVVLGGYAGASPLANVLSPFGYYEATAYGASRSVDDSMPWDLVKAALLAICDTPLADWGGPLTYRGVSYAVDVTAVPAMGSDYRVRGSGQSLLDLVGQVCRDAGCDYFVTLVGLTVVVNVVDRTAATAPGSLAALVAAQAGVAARTSIGTENRPDPTSVVLTGGAKSTVFVGTAVLSDWGDDPAGRPVVGVPYKHPGLADEPCDAFVATALGAEDAAGGLFYPTNTIELRCAKQSYDAWEAYATVHKGEPLPPAKVGDAYAADVTLRGASGAYTWTTTGTLPPGLAFSGEGTAGSLTGTPTVAGTYDFFVVATPDAGGDPVAEHYLVRVGTAGLTVTGGGPPNAAEREPYAYQFAVSGGAGSAVWAIASGSLPAGVSLDPGTGKLSGVPLAAGTSLFTVTVTDRPTGQSGGRPLALTVTPRPGALSLSTDPLPDATQGEAYSATLTASGGTAPYTYSMFWSSHPPGVVLNPLTGAVSGTPTADGDYPVVVTATDAAGATGTRAYTLRVAPTSPAPFLKPRGLAARLGCLYKPGAGAESKADALRTLPAAVRAAADADRQGAAVRLWQLLRGYFDEFYGKRYLVAVPDVLVKLPADGEGAPVYSAEPAEAGYLPAGAASVGLDGVDRDAFEADDGRVRPFAVVPDADLLDAGAVGSDRSAVSGNRLYVLAGADPRPRAAGGACYARVELASPAFLREPVAGGELAVSLFHGGDRAAYETTRSTGSQGTLGTLSVHPRAVTPSHVGVPLKSNVAVYGPWAAAGASGKVVYARDDSLVPWNYGSEADLEAAALARVSAAASDQVAADGGEVTLAGPPLAAPGATFSGGPVLTAVDAQWGAGGITTTYRFTTYSSRQFRGEYARRQDDRVRAAAARALDAGRAAARLAARRSALAAGAARGKAAARAYAEEAPGRITRRSPHECVVAQAWRAADGSTRVGAAAVEGLEGLLLARPEATGDPTFRNTALAHWTSVVRGYSAEKPAWTGSALPTWKWVSPTGLGGNAPLTSESLFPRPAGADVDFRTWGTGYQGADARSAMPPATGVRDVALAAPQVLAGWGWGTDGRAYPTGATPTGFAPDHLRRSDLYPVGPVDHLWDPFRGVWTSHDVLTGVTPSGIGAGATGWFHVGGSAAWALSVKNRGSAAVPTGASLVAAYAANENRWVTLDTTAAATGAGTAVYVSGPKDGTSGYHPGRLYAAGYPPAPGLGAYVWWKPFSGEVGAVPGLYPAWPDGTSAARPTGSADGGEAWDCYAGPTFGEAVVPGRVVNFDAVPVCENGVFTRMTGANFVYDADITLRGVGLAAAPPPPPPPPTPDPDPEPEGEV